MSTNSGAHQYLSITCWGKANFTHWIQKCSFGVFVLLLVNFLGCQSSDKDRGSIPNNLHDLSWRNLRNIDFEISISIISSPSIQSSNDGYSIESAKVGDTCKIQCAKHVDLSSTNVGLVLVVYSVLVEPVIKCWFEINMVSEISRTSWGHKEMWFIRNGVSAIELFACSFVVVFDQSKVAGAI